MASKVITNGLKRTALSVALGFCFATPVVLAQSSVGHVFGTTSAGASVTVENTATGQSREITADSSGRFSVSQLAPGNYKVTAGGVTRTVEVRVGTGTPVNFTADIGTVEVIGGGAVQAIDVSSVESTTVLTAEQIMRLPVGRDVTSVALLAPGTVRGDTGFGNLASFGGASVAENGYYVNGFDVTNIRTFLSYADIPFEAIGEQQTKTGGYGAEFGRSLGGVVNIVTKRGSNDWKFGASLYWAPEGLQEHGTDSVTQSTNPGDPHYYVYRSANSSSNMNWNAYASGAIVKDRLFMFALLSGQNFDADGYGRETTNKRSNNSPGGIIKLDWNITDNHIVELTAIENKDKLDTKTYQSSVDYQTYHGNLVSDTTTENGGRIYIGKYTGYLTDNFTLSIAGGWLRNVNNYVTPEDFPGSNCVRAYDSTSNPNVVNYVGCFNPARLTIRDPNFGPETDIRRSWRIDAEWQLGDHKLRFGYDTEKFTSGHAGTTYTGGSYWRHFNSGAAGRTVNGVFLAPNTNYARQWVRNSNSGSYAVENTAFYLEDSWQINDNWLIYAGLRNESFSNLNGDGEVFVEADSNIAPRLGFSWDINGDGRSKLYGTAGRYFIPVSSNTNIRGSGAELFTEGFYQTTGFDPATGLPTGVGAQIGPLNVNSDGSVADPRTLAATNLSPMYQDEYIIGYQKQLNEAWTLGVKGVYRSVGAGMDDWCSVQAIQSWADDEGYNNFDYHSLAGCFLLNPGEDVGIALDLEGDGTLTNVTIPAEYFELPKYKREYRAIEFTAEGHGDNWWLQGSYTWSKSYGNVEGYVNSSLEQVDAGATQDFDNEKFEDGADGYLPNDRRHTFKVFGSYDFNDEWSIGGDLLVQSGRPISCFGFVPLEGNLDDNAISGYSGSSFYCKLPNDTSELRQRGGEGRTPWTWTFGASVTYTPAWAGKHLQLSVAVRNLFNTQTVTEYNEFSATGSNASNDYDENFLNEVNFQAPRTVRLSARYEF